MSIFNKVWGAGCNHFMKGYIVNEGYGHLPWTAAYYSERIVEIPFLFKNLRSAPLSVLDIGCSESINPVRLAALGYAVTGMDLQEYNFRHENLDFIKADFLEYNFSKMFDIAINISAVEHFGLFHYGNAKYDLDADKKAVAKVHDLLKPSGQFIFTAPCGIHQVTDNFQRVYDSKDLAELLKGFRSLNKEFYQVRSRSKISRVDESQAMSSKFDSVTSSVACLNLEKI